MTRDPNGAMKPRDVYTLAGMTVALGATVLAVIAGSHSSHSSHSEATTLPAPISAPPYLSGAEEIGRFGAPLSPSSALLAEPIPEDALTPPANP